MYSSLRQIKQALAEGETSCVDLVDHYLERIESLNHLNAFVEVFTDSAKKQAIEIDEKIKNGIAGKLAGMVIGIKDLISYKGHKVAASSKILTGFEAIFNSTVVERLLAEDAIILGRLNCDEFAMGASNETSHFGPVLNHADTSKVSGGSSGGSAVAVQAGLCLASLGTDTGGSVRQPAAFCGVLGLKPTYSRVSRHGIVAYASSFDQVGPIGNNAQDIALIMETIAGKDDFDATVSQNEVPAYSENLSFEGKKSFAYLPETLHSEGLDPEIKAKMLSLIEKLKADGHTVEEAKFPLLEYIVPTYYVLTMAEASSNLSRYDGVHYGYRSENATDLFTTYSKSRSEGFGTEVKRRIMLGTFVLSAGYYDAYYAKAQKVRRMIRDTTVNILKDHDYILLPTSPTTAFGIGEKIDDPIVMYLADIFTVQASLAGTPAISMPLGKHSSGLPFGIQLIANKFEEKELLAAADYMMENHAD